MRKKNKKTNIQRETVLKLWALSAGRCEFLGCNEPLWKDGLSWVEANFAHIAHIVSVSPNGPRGDMMRSKKLSKDFFNLMLVCQKHHKLIDDKKYVKKYPEEKLKEYKSLHEERIRVQTSMQNNMVTIPVIFTSNIKGRKVDIPFDQVCEAIKPKYPINDKGIRIDFTNLVGNGSVSYWESSKEQIAKKVELNISSIDKGYVLSIFAIGPIPLLIYFGKCIGNIIPSDLFQRHRDSQNWAWKKTRVRSTKYIIKRLNLNMKTKEVILVLSLSGNVHNKEVQKMVNKKLPRYEITIKKPSLNFLKSRKQLIGFKEAYREVISDIRDKYGHKVKIHLFSAIPAPIAVACGQELLPKVDPVLKVYDYDNKKYRFITEV